MAAKWRIDKEVEDSCLIDHSVFGHGGLIIVVTWVHNVAVLVHVVVTVYSSSRVVISDCLDEAALSMMTILKSLYDLLIT